MLTALGCRQLWDADSSGDADIWKSACFRWVTLGHTSALDALSVHAFHAIRLFHAFMRYVLYHALCDMPCIMLHAICPVSCFHAICLVSCFMRYALYHASCDKSVLCEGLALGHI